MIYPRTDVDTIDYRCFIFTMLYVFSQLSEPITDDFTEKWHGNLNTVSSDCTSRTK